MGDETGIEWADSTFNPWIGCAKVSAACRSCYAESYAVRYGQPELWRGERRLTSEANWRKPLAWQRRLEREGGTAPHLVFCSSLADVFEDHDALPGWRAALWALIERTPRLTWLLLTKRPENVRRMVPAAWLASWPLNVWTGATVENQETARERIPYLLRVPGHRFLSMEPLLGPVELCHIDVEGHPAAKPQDGDRIGWYQIDALTGRNRDMGRPCPDAPRIHWVIAGGESGPQARPTHPGWIRSLWMQCQDVVPFLFKQWGEWAPSDEVEANGTAWQGMHEQDPEDGGAPVHFWPDGYPRELAKVQGRPVAETYGPIGGDTVVLRVGKKRAGRLLDGRQHNERGPR